MSDIGWFQDPEHPQRLRYRSKDGWTLRVRYYAGTESEYETELAPPLRRGFVTLAPSAKTKTDMSERYASFASPSAPKPKQPRGGIENSGKKLLMAIVLILVGLFLFNSCQSNGWQMGVDGDGYRVQCEDGTWSNSGENQGLVLGTVA